MSHLGFISARHYALDSPSVISKLATPKPATAMNFDMSHVIDDATSTMHDTYDETTSMLDTTVPLGEFLDEQLARVRENEIIETVGVLFTIYVPPRVPFFY